MSNNRAKAVENIEEPLPDPLMEKIEQELNSEPKQNKGKELPAFMKKLFKK